MHCRRGFSFTEVLFAVMLLGIGFIMIAAVFPVAIQQNQATLQETTAQAVANDAINQLRNLSVTSTNTIFPGTNGQYKALNVPYWSQNFSLNFINSADPRFAWVAFYRRDNDNCAKLIILVLQNQNSTAGIPGGNLFTPTAPGVGLPIVPGTLVYIPNPANQAFYAPASIVVSAPIVASVFYNADGTSSIAMSASDVTSPGGFIPVSWAAPGAFVIVGSDPAGSMAGRVFRLGQKLFPGDAQTPGDPQWRLQFNPDATQQTGFQLVPGFDLRQDQSEYRATITSIPGVPPTPPPPYLTPGLNVFIVGTPTSPPSTTPPLPIPVPSTSPQQYEVVGSATGTAQDIAVFTATIPCK
jgi:type II secretory pathway pseudopilin PulG